jgi:glycosyltransferase involved in cell wall biosynthesis
MSSSRKVILVCMVDSIHTARWLSTFSGEKIRFILMPSTPNRSIHPIIRDLIHGNPNQKSTVEIKPFGGKLSIPLWLLDILFRDWIRGAILSRLIKSLKPDYVHALELNHAGYIMSHTHKRDKPNLVKFMATNWGSDIFWFQQFSNHRKRLKKLLTGLDFYSAECHRDLELALKYGFTGKFMEVLPNAGGFEHSQLNRNLTKTSDREIILIKGYQSFVGRAIMALKAVSSISKDLSNYKFVVYSANYKTQRLVKKLKSQNGLEITCYGKKQLSHDEMLSLFETARIYLGVSLSDGISTSLLEAMAGGAFPIQTSTSCGDEWIVNGVSGFLVEANIESISQALLVASTNDELVDAASEINLKLVRNKLDKTFLNDKLIRFYTV